MTTKISTCVVIPISFLKNVVSATPRLGVSRDVCSSDVLDSLELPKAVLESTPVFSKVRENNGNCRVAEFDSVLEQEKLSQDNQKDDNSEGYQPFLRWIVFRELKQFSVGKGLECEAESMLFEALYLKAESAFHEALKSYTPELSMPFLQYAFGIIRKTIGYELLAKEF